MSVPRTSVIDSYQVLVCCSAVLKNELTTPDTSFEWRPNDRVISQLICPVSSSAAQVSTETDICPEVHPSIEWVNSAIVGSAIVEAKTSMSDVTE